MSQNPNQNPYTNTSQAQGANPVGNAPQYNQNQGDGTGGLIPYKNAPALIAYYVSLLSLLPVIGIPFGIASFVLGVIGLKKRARNPVIKGSVHAWIGIVLGGGTTLLWIGLIVLGFGVRFFGNR
ncbi:MAG: hypothetical protein L7W43_06770 [Rubripirellula sp.]|nr:hypothetical protein [Rhodopirellula sp.]MCH1439338.1 hypothetical protein [Rubripirellula sp.]